MDQFRKEIVALVGNIIDAVDGKLPVANIADARELLDHNEWGEALLLICTQLGEYEVPVSRDVLGQIVRAGEKIGYDKEVWEGLEVLA